MNQRKIENIIVDFLKGFGPERIGLFGSFSRKENTSESDIDILIKFKTSPSLFQLIKIENDLSELIGYKVDIVTEGSIRNSIIKQQIKNDLKIIYHV